MTENKSECTSRLRTSLSHRLMLKVVQRSIISIISNPVNKLGTVPSRGRHLDVKDGFGIIAENKEL